MTSAQVHTNEDSKEGISGTFGFVLAFGDFFESLEERINAAVSETVDAETQVLQNTLSNHPDWAPMKDAASVSVENGMISYRVEDSRAIDIEYGNPQKKIIATGLLRSTAVERSAEVSSNITARIMGGLQNA